MNFFEAQNLFKQMYPGKKISFSFDKNCHRFHELVLTDGKYNPVHHIENHKVRIDVEGMPTIYAPIAPHRETIAHDDMMKLMQEIK